MKNFIIIFLSTLTLLFGATSCYSAYGVGVNASQDDVFYDDYTDNISVIIRFGTPYYVDGYLRYYLYNGLYYYPFYYDNYWYFRPYRSIIYDYRFVPNRYDIRFRPGMYGFGRPNDRWNGRPPMPPRFNNNPRPQPNPNNDINRFNRRPQFNNGNRSFGNRTSQHQRPVINTQPSNRTFGNGNFNRTQPPMRSNPTPNRSFGNGHSGGSFNGGGGFFGRR
jgi:hypothetical protein